MKQMEFHMKKDGKWIPFNMNSCTGKPTQKEVWLNMEGRDIVVKFTADDLVCYIAGTEELREHYKNKGFKTISFPVAVEQMERANTPFFDQEIIDFYMEVLNVFPGTSLSKIADEREA